MKPVSHGRRLLAGLLDAAAVAPAFVPIAVLLGHPGRRHRVAGGAMVVLVLSY